MVTAILENVADYIKSPAPIVRQKTTDILQKDSFWLMLTDDFLDSEK
jgi:hypothetical protein